MDRNSRDSEIAQDETVLLPPPLSAANSHPISAPPPKVAASRIRPHNALPTTDLEGTSVGSCCLGRSAARFSG